jgi:predicted ATPase
LAAAHGTPRPRQQTLSATIDWSYQLLDQEQQRTFVQCSVFAAGATLDAARTVTGATSETLHALTGKSLIDRRQQPDGVTRLVMLETVRQYALERLDHDPEQHTIRQRHLDHYLQLVEQTTSGFSSHNERRAVQVLDREIDNITAALQWALQQAPEDALRLAGHLGEYWRIRGDPGGLSWLVAALQAAGEHAPAQDRGRAQLGRSQALGVRQPREIARDAAGEFPPLRTLRLTNLPLQPGPLFGRGQELGELLELAPANRLLTLTSPGGSGKTRLALALAGELSDEYRDGAWWVPLAAVTDPGLVLATIAQSLGARAHIQPSRLLATNSLRSSRSHRDIC